MRVHSVEREAACDSLGKVFIAGTGRSGTTVLHQILGRHPEAYTVPYESKFIVEGDGLNALIPRLHESVSLTASDHALDRFVRLMDADLSEIDLAAAKSNGPGGPTDRWRYFDHIGPDYYFPPLRAFLRDIVQFEHDAFDAFPRFFPDRAELIALARRLVAEMFGAPALDQGKTFWVEKTPSNLVAMDFLWELLPEAVIIHIKRDPRAVLHSFLNQDWLPRGRDNCAYALRSIYWGWERLKPRLALTSRRYIEIRLEDLVEHPRHVLNAIARAIRIDNRFPADGLDRDLAWRWKAEMSADLLAYAERELRSAFDRMDYDI